MATFIEAGRLWCLQAERGAKLTEVATHEKQLQDIQNQLEQYAENDPDKINSMSRLLLLHMPIASNEKMPVPTEPALHMAC